MQHWQDPASDRVRQDGRRYVELTQLAQDFILPWRGLEAIGKNGLPACLSAATTRKSAWQEDTLLLFGSRTIEAEGLSTAAGTHEVRRGDWSSGRATCRDVAQAWCPLQAAACLAAAPLSSPRRVRIGPKRTHSHSPLRVLSQSGMVVTKCMSYFCGVPYLDLQRLQTAVGRGHACA